MTQDLLHRPPIERKLSDEQSSDRLDTILADGNSDCHQPHVSRFPCRCRWLVSRCASGPGPGNVPQGRSGDRGAVPPRRLVSALEAPIAVAGSLRRLPTRPKATGRVKRHDNQLHRARVLEVRIHSPPAVSQTNSKAGLKKIRPLRRHKRLSGHPLVTGSEYRGFNGYST